MSQWWNGNFRRNCVNWGCFQISYSRRIRKYEFLSMNEWKKLGCAAIRPPVSFTLVLWFSIHALEHSSSRSPARTSSLMWQTVVAEVTYRCGGRQRPRRRLSDSSTQIALFSYVTPLLADTYPPIFCHTADRVRSHLQVRWSLTSSLTTKRQAAVKSCSVFSNKRRAICQGVARLHTVSGDKALRRAVWFVKERKPFIGAAYGVKYHFFPKASAKAAEIDNTRMSVCELPSEHTTGECVCWLTLANQIILAGLICAPLAPLNRDSLTPPVNLDQKPIDNPLTTLYDR